MRTWTRLALCLFAACAVAASPAFSFDLDSVWNPAIEAPTVSDAQFTELYGAMLTKATGAQVKVVGPLELSVVYKNGYKGTTYLNNVWNACKGKPAIRKTTVGRFLNSEVDLASRKGGTASEEFSKDQLVPLVKHKEYVDRIQQTTNAKSGAFITEPLGSDLFLVYAFDMPNGMQIVSESSLAGAHLNRAELRELSTRNLYRILGKKFSVEDVKDNVLAVQADGNYEASILSDRQFWNSRAVKSGDKIIMAVPSRSLVLFTAQKNASGIELIKRIAAKDFGRGDHPISDTLYAWDGKLWQPFH